MKILLLQALINSIRSFYSSELSKHFVKKITVSLSVTHTVISHLQISITDTPNSGNIYRLRDDENFRKI